MADKDLIAKLADIPLAKPGYGALNMTAPVMVQMNPEGKWQSSKPDNLDEDKLKSVVQHLMRTNAVSAAQSYCSQCALQNKTSDGNPNYIPVIMMPIQEADSCPFNMDCEIQKMKETKDKKTKKKAEKADVFSKETDADKVMKKTKKRGFVLQRLTDFDLLSQW